MLDEMNQVKELSGAGSEDVRPVSACGPKLFREIEKISKKSWRTLFWNDVRRVIIRVVNLDQ